METPEEVISLETKDQTHQIVRGKRTKRVRPQSPLPLTATVAKTEELYQFVGDDDNTKYFAAPTTTSSAEFEENSNINHYSSSTEEEEDMANCLILLAQGQSRFSPKPAKEEGNMMMITMKTNNDNNYNHNSSSKRFMEASTMGANRAGFYVYECKTCNKTFPSFQALGGHRASHKKLKNLSPISAILDKEKKKDQDFTICSPTPLSFQSLNSGSNLNNKNKVHECSVCGAEFASGQALGGHMRRHRAPNGTTATTANNAFLALNNNRVGLGLEADQYDNEDHHHPRKKRNILSLDLDLNLPAPEADHQSESSSFAFEPKKQPQQASLVFSSAHALVDCHY
ncbi:hypothetical protein QN277_011358 [Acacia crassicarpa]|uniref:C2H2-type domain-containing protein n=1 Tax=Acacia crassicarpa TaxID=499986 RepID=A0AAE1MYK2_9FABA|nr:hypothetical protein QN277_011358 [Acacia crassicarpa]